MRDNGSSLSEYYGGYRPTFEITIFYRMWIYRSKVHRAPIPLSRLEISRTPQNYRFRQRHAVYVEVVITYMLKTRDLHEIFDRMLFRD